MTQHRIDRSGNNSSMSIAHQESCQSLTVLFDGACPLCRREVDVYRRLTPVNDGPPLKWLDVSQPQSCNGLSDEQATYLARFHVQQSDGKMLSGAAAFVALWAVLPGWRWLARLASLPGATALLEVMYQGFLRFRPAMQKAARAFDAPRVSKEWVGDLRSDHAGELGAVWIYRGVLAFSGDPGVREFATRHAVTEQSHLDKIEAVLPWVQRSRLLIGWRVAGFLTGALPALFGPRAVYSTIAAVETFVDKHYQHQIDRLEKSTMATEIGMSTATDSAVVAGDTGMTSKDLLTLLAACQADECEHRDEALALHASSAAGASASGLTGWLLRTWCTVVGSGSAMAVTLARRV